MGRVRRRVPRRGVMGLLGTLGIGAIGTAVAPPAVRMDGSVASAAAGPAHQHDTTATAAQDEGAPKSTSIHWHGLMVPNSQDGVPFITQPPIKPGEPFTYESAVREGKAGSHMYHSHHNAAFQVTKGLLGAFIIEPRDPATRPAFDREYTMVLNDGPIGGFSLNGNGFPATQPLLARKGERVLIRYMNGGLMIHPMHLHGMPRLVIAQDGWLLPQPYTCDTLRGPGLPLPHPQPRRERARHVRHGDRVDRGRMTFACTGTGLPRYGASLRAARRSPCSSNQSSSLSMALILPSRRCPTRRRWPIRNAWESRTAS